MLELDGLIGLITVGLWVFCFIDVLLTPDGQQRNLPKLAWASIVLVFPLIGAIAWLAAGKNYDKTGSAVPATRVAPGYPKSDRPGRHVPTNPDDDEVFLAGLRKRAEEQRQRARDQSGPTSTEPGANPEAEQPEA